MPKIAWHCHFNWTLSQDFDPLFNDNNLFGPLFHMLKSFCIWFRFQGDIRMCKKLSAVCDTAKAKCFFIIFQRFFSTLKSQFHNIFRTVFFPNNSYSFGAKIYEFNHFYCTVPTGLKKYISQGFLCFKKS